MRAAVYKRYGPPEVLWIEEVPTPTPRNKEILVEVRATTVSSADLHMRRAEPVVARLYNGLARPRRVTVLGMELAGEVAAVGRDVRRFKEGDPVFGATGFGFGAYAEYACLPEQGSTTRGLAAMKPSAVTFEQAAALPFGGLAALNLLRKARLERGQKVLVYGASGSTGTYAVQLAKYFGAEVTGVCSTANLALVTALGADRVVDYTAEDFTDTNRYDIVFDAVLKMPKSKCRNALAHGGVYLNVGMSRKDHAEDLTLLGALCEAGSIKPVIDRRYPLDQVVEAHRYVDQGHKKGHVIITMTSNEAT
jgi:NADPH:quinone reductase-like Zn-dependent oxidoreductase